MVGIQNTADIKLTLTLDKKGLSDLRAAMKTINASLKTQEAVKQFASMDKALKGLKKELRAAKSELTAFKKEQKATAVAAKSAGDIQAAAMNKVEQERREAIAQVKANIAAEKALDALTKTSSARVREYANRLRERYGAEKALQMMQRASAAAERTKQAALGQTVVAYDRNRKAITASAAAQINVNRGLAAGVRAHQQSASMIVKATTAAGKLTVAYTRNGAAISKSAAQTINVQQRMAGGAQRLAAITTKGNNQIVSSANKVVVAYTRQGKAVTQAGAAAINMNARMHNGNQRFVKSQRAVTSALAKSRTVIHKFSTALSQAEQDMDALFRASFRLSIVGFTLQRFANNIMRWGGQIMETFEEFEYSMLRAAGALEIFRDTTLDGSLGFDVMREKILDLSTEMKLFAANDVAEALYFWGSATGQVVTDTEGLTTAMSGLRAIMKASAMTNTDYETTIKGVYSILTQFYSGDLDKTTEVTEKIFLSTQKTAAEFNDLIQSFKMVGPVAAQVGADFDQVNEAFGKLSDLGLRGSLAGRGLRQMFIQMARPSGPAQKKWKELFEDNPRNKFDGKSMREVVFPEGEFIGIEGYITAVAEAVEHLNEADRLQAIARVTTANSLPMTIALMAQQRNELLGLSVAQDKFKDSDPTEYFRENWASLDESWKAARASLSRVIEAIKIELGSAMAVALKPLIEMVNGWAMAIRIFVEMNHALVQLITKFAAVVAVGAMVAGTIFIIAGALLGLFAALRLVWDATGTLRGTLTKFTGALGILFLALVDNFEYLKRSAIEILKNLDAAFEDVTIAGEDFMSILNSITEPAREVLGLVIRIVADILVFASALVAGASEMAHFSTVLEILIAALRLIISAKIIMGIWGLVAGMNGLTATVGGGALAHGLGLIYFGLHMIAAKGIRVSIQLLILKLRALMAAIPIVGWAALGISLILTADQLPIIGDLVKGITRDWRSLNKELKESTSFFGDDIASDLEILALSLAPSAVKLPDAKKVLEPWVGELNAFAKANASHLELTPLGVDSSTEDIEATRLALNLESSLWEGTEALATAWNALDKSLSDGSKLYSETMADVQQDGINNSEEWKTTWRNLATSMVESGRNLKISENDFGKAILSLADNVQATYRGVVGSFTPKGSVLDDLTAKFLGDAPDKMKAEEVAPWLEKFNKDNAEMLFSAIDIPEALRLLGPRVGEESTIINTELAKLIEKLLSEQDPYVLREEAIKGRVELGGLGLLQLIGDFDEFGDIQPLLQALNAAVAAGTADLEGGKGAAALDVVEANLKTALETMTVNMLLEAMPDLGIIAEQMKMLGVDNSKGSYEQMAALFLESFVDGQSLAEMVTSGDFKGTSISTLKSIAQALVDAGYGGDELAKFVEEATLEDGSTAGETAAVSLGESFVTAFNAIPLNVSDELDAIKKAKELGKSVQVAARSIKQALKLTKAGFGKDSNVKSRDIARGAFTRATQFAGSRHEKLTGRAESRAARGDTEGSEKALGAARKAGKKTINALLPAYDSLPTSMQQGVRDFISMYAEDFPKQALKMAESMNIEWPEGFLESLAPTPEEIQESISTAQTEAVGTYDPLTGTMIDAGVTPAGKNVGTATEETTPNLKPSGVSAADSFLDGFKSGTTVTAVSEFAASSLTNLASAIASNEAEALSVYNAALALGQSFAKGFKTSLQGDGNANVVNMQMGMQIGTNAASTLALENATTAGSSVGSAWATGFKDGLMGMKGTISVAFAEAVEDGEGESPPKQGPLKNIDQWGKNIGVAWSEGINKGMNRGVESLNNAQAFTSAEITHKGKREVTVKLEVTSPDGTANKQSKEAMRRGALDAFAIAGIEHYASVG